MNSNNKVDLHIHSSFSDGLYSPSEIIKKAKKKRLKAIGLTDHDTILGLPEAIRVGKHFGIEVVPGIELSCNFEDKELHLLGYYFYLPGRLEKALKVLIKSRFNRAFKMVDRLNKLKLPISNEELLWESGEAAPGRLHLARLMVKKGYSQSLQDAFKDYLNLGKPAYIARQKLDYRYAINLLKKSGAIIILAHPGTTGEDIFSIQLLKKCGIHGIEVYHPLHDLAQIKRYRKIAESESLLVVGGTDYHGDDQLYPGYVSLSYNYLSQLKQKKRINKLIC